MEKQLTQQCETCGNHYDKAFKVIKEGRTHTFDSFECAIHALAPSTTTETSTAVPTARRRAAPASSAIEPEAPPPIRHILPRCSVPRRAGQPPDFAGARAGQRALC